MKFIGAYFIVLLSFFQILNAQECYNENYFGDGTYYDSIAGTSSGNCSTPIAIDDYKYCALNNFQYNNSEACEACINVQGPNGSIVLRVVDRCPECLSGDVDMNQQAFAEIAEVIDGRVPISWSFVECPLQENIEIVLKEGSSMYHTEILVQNLKHAISSLEYLDDEGLWQNTERQLYNFFVESNGINSPMTLRATSVLGEELVFENVSYGTNTPLPANLTVQTTQQFSTPANCSTLSIPTNKLDAIKLSYYPNPTKNELYIESNASNFWEGKVISISNINGKFITKNKTIEGVQSQKIELSHLSKGIYILNILENSKVYSSHKIVLN